MHANWSTPLLLSHGLVESNQTSHSHVWGSDTARNQSMGESDDSYVDGQLLVEGTLKNPITGCIIISIKTKTPVDIVIEGKGLKRWKNTEV